MQEGSPYVLTPKMLDLVYMYQRLHFLHIFQWYAHLLARDAFVRTNRRAVTVMFVCLSVCPFVCLSHWDRRVLWSYDAR